MNRPTEIRSIAKRLVLAAMLLGFAVPAPAVHAQQASSKAEAAPAGSSEKGKENLKKFGCAACHGYSGQGGTGPRLAQTPLTFPLFVRYVQKPTRTMPPFGTQLTSSELTDIYAFLKSVPNSLPAKSIPLLNE